MMTHLTLPRRRLLQMAGGLALTLLWPHQADGQTGRQVRDIAKAVTVLVSPQSSSGSGVLIKQEGSSYYVLTAKHVMESTRAGEEADVITSDGQSHAINTQAILYLSGVDLALIRFDSDRNYPVATLGNSASIAETDTIYIAGFPLPGQAITSPTFTITKGAITGKGQYQRGYGLIYDNVTQPGMSGGPILSQTGQVIGIHGLAEGERVQGVAVKAGLNLGVPINTILDLTPLALQQAPPETSFSSSPNPVASASEAERTFRAFLDQHYAAIAPLIETRDAARLFNYMPIDKERFRYRQHTGVVQNYNDRVAGASQFFAKKPAREKWKLSFEITDVQMPTVDQAIVSHIETVKWSYWPGILRGVFRRRETTSWERVNGQWKIVSVEEVERL
ncbi:trypsin-like peptidase domain-containing protein [Acaryochloris marina]|uniref:Protease, putative n=1 Tax=Acaryochloris marina (strain MBIC 11017) TaxID=329726 RepID=B0CCF9_ACAM1|nr:trypsin-like peptidase domain-containing protein [Acaryochloris marina]ABW27988.1 protease, putative [Acaryochloris marina MBIC11017]